MTDRETGAAAIWAADHDMPCEWDSLRQVDQELYLRSFDAAVEAYTHLAAQRGWHMRQDLTGTGPAAATEFEWDK
ncbi:hypothetical protein LCGC14_1882800 [marine sediment metagenome]|uniref:Uncharacterized protein n=1 Tax=marine sediment metagenome TaxID=412755 RepID=A0A0F9GQ27_9ZZZZ